jgi:ribokinase
MILKKCLVIGDINIDIAIHSDHYPAEGGNASAEQADFRLGGSGCITALCLQFLGQPTALAANMGMDVFSQFASDYLDASGLEVSLVKKFPNEQTGFFLTLVTSGGKHTMFSNRGANAVAFDENELLSKLKEFDHLHVSGYSLKGNDQYAVVRQMMESAFKSGISISLDPGVCTSEQAAERILGLLKYVRYFLPNRDELASLVKAMEFDEKIETLLELGCKVVILKQGSLGGKYFERGFSVGAPAEIDKGKAIIDTTGAGDCFNAGFLKGILNGSSPEDALKLANTASFKLITSQHGIIDLINEVRIS